MMQLVFVAIQLAIISPLAQFVHVQPREMGVGGGWPGYGFFTLSYMKLCGSVVTNHIVMAMNSVLVALAAWTASLVKKCRDFSQMTAGIGGQQLSIRLEDCKCI
jgi:hypothetical protein